MTKKQKILILSIFCFTSIVFIFILSCIFSSQNENNRFLKNLKSVKVGDVKRNVSLEMTLDGAAKQLILTKTFLNNKIKCFMIWSQEFYGNQLINALLENSAQITVDQVKKELFQILMQSKIDKKIIRDIQKITLYENISIFSRIGAFFFPKYEFVEYNNLLKLIKYEYEKSPNLNHIVFYVDEKSIQLGILTDFYDIFTQAKVTRSKKIQTKKPFDYIAMFLASQNFTILT